MPDALLEMKEKIVEASKLFEEFKAEHKKAIAENREKLGEFEEKSKKMTDAITAVMEEKQKMDQRLAALEAAERSVEKSAEESKSDAEKKKIDAAVNVYFKKNSFKSGFSFAEFAEAAGLDVKAMSVNSDPDGGYFVLPTYGGLINTRVFETSPIRSLANVITIGSDAYEVNIYEDEATLGGWVGESGTRSESATPQFKKIRIPTHEQYAMPRITQKILEDGAFNLEQWLSGEVAAKFSRAENTAFVSGNGVSKPKGLLTYSAWTTAGTYEHDKIEQVNSGTSGAFKADGLIDLQGSLLEAYQPNAVWLTRRASFTSIVKLKTGTGEYLFNRGLDSNTGSPFNLLGKPVVFANDLEAVGANALAMIYGDIRAAYTIVERPGIQIIRDPYSHKASGAVEYLHKKRVGGAVVNFEAIKIQKLAV